MLAFGQAGVGGRLLNADGVLWDALRVPFISVLADSPSQLPTNHQIAAIYVANGYVYKDWLDVWRRFVRSPQIAGLLPQPALRNSQRDATPWSERRHRMVLVKTGRAPEEHRRSWSGWPRRFRAIVEDCAAAALAAGVGDITDVFLAAADHHGLALEGRPEVLFFLMNAADLYLRDLRSTAMVQALLDLPVDVIGRGWDHLKSGSHRARFHPPLDAETLPLLFAETQFLLNTLPNFSYGTHERVLYGFAGRCCVVTNENADMRQRFRDLPTYFAIDTESPELADRLAAIYHGEERFDDRTQPALDLVETQFSAEAFMRALIELSLEVRAAAALPPLKP